MVSTSIYAFQLFLFTNTPHNTLTKPSQITLVETMISCESGMNPVAMAIHSAHRG